MPHWALLSDVNEGEFSVAAKVACTVSDLWLPARDCEGALRSAIGTQDLG